MNLLAPHQTEEPHSCSYRPEDTRCDQYFLAVDVSARELDRLLSEGWRKFGCYFFKPSCGSCRACTPLRVDVNKFRPNRSQSRAFRKGKDLDVTFGPLDYNPRVFELYREHSKVRFGKDEHDLEQFMFSFYTPSCPGLQVSISLAGELVGVGWLDIGEISLSSVYFCFDPKHSNLNLGTCSILAGLDYARKQGLQWNYLGFRINGNRSTEYKANFKPYELLDWTTGQWKCDL
jgi:arginine-tRNA-protein transferase